MAATQTVTSNPVSVEAQKEYEEFVKKLPKGKTFYTEQEWKEKELKEERKRSNLLVRCRIICMNPEKKHVPGEMISVGSAKTGTFKKYIPYNSDEPYHIPYILYTYLKNKECPVKFVKKLPNGVEVNRSRMIKEYNIEVLPPLTRTELLELAKRQAMTDAGDDG